MTNKNVSQLPINSDPQDSDWLLGASGNSPSVFQKIPVGSLIPTTQNSGSIKFSLPVNQNTALTSSGYYFTDNIAANIEIDCIGLGIGEHINWVNLSTTKAIYFSGISSVNGVSIPANKGIKISYSTSIEFFFLDANHNVRIISGIYNIDWLPGQEPPYKVFLYSSDNDTNDCFYYLGTNKATTSFMNPHSRGLVTVTESSIYNVYYGYYILDRDNSYFHSNTQNNPNISIQFNQGMTFALGRISLLPRQGGGIWSFSPFTIEGYQDSWVTLASELSFSGQNWFNYIVNENPTAFYTKFRLTRNANSYADLSEVRFYGYLKEN